MNFLAHLYLSGDHKKIALGNLIGDMVKGDAWKNYEHDIKTGLLLHRAIDEFTDAHPIFKHTTTLIKPHFNRYAGIVADIYYDHFLAAHWQKYSNRELSVFVQEIYILLIKNYLTLPPRAQRIVPFMILRNWLGTYQSIPHLHQVFLGMHRRTGELGNMNKATDILQLYYSELEADFMEFFSDVQLFSQRKLIELSASPNQISTPQNSRNTE